MIHPRATATKHGPRDLHVQDSTDSENSEEAAPIRHYDGEISPLPPEDVVGIPIPKWKEMSRSIFSRRHSVSDRTLEELRARFPGWTFNYGDDGIHPHPIGAAERAITEELVCREISRTYGYNMRITDIGGNANRHASCGRKKIHSCNPYLDPVDVTRYHDSRYRNDANFCHVKAQQCCTVADVYMAINSIYYISREDLVYLVHRSVKKVLYATVHVFDNLYGTMHNGESNYEVMSDGTELLVSMMVNGNVGPYVHNGMFYLKDQYFEYRNKAIAWGGRKVGDTWIYTFVPAPVGMTQKRNPEMPLTVSIKREEHVGEVSPSLSVAHIKPEFDVTHVTSRGMWSWGPFIGLRAETTKMVLIPKGLINELSFLVMGKLRTTKLFESFLKDCKKIILRYDMPSKIREDCVLYAIPIAFSLTMTSEITAVQEMRTWSFKTKCAEHLRALNFDYSWMPFMKPATWWPSNKTRLKQVNETISEYNDTRRSVPAQQFDMLDEAPFGLIGKECSMPVKEKRPRSSIKLPEELTRIDDKPQLYPIGISFSNCIPTVPYGSLINEYFAVSNRAIMKCPGTSADRWEGVVVLAEEALLPFTPVDPNFYEWNDTFPPGKRRKQLLAFEHVREFGLKEKDFIRKSFVKREATVRISDEPEEYDPRLIQGASDNYNVVLGPFMHKVSKQLASLWNVDSPTVYTSGLTSEDLGKWREQFGDHLTGVIIEIDQSRFDAHQGKESFDLEMLLHKSCGIDQHIEAKAALNSQKKTLGYTSKGIKYAVPYTRKSGDPNTSVGNSFINGVMTRYCIETAFQTMGLIDEVKMLILGDDNLSVSTIPLNHYQQDELRELLVLGFRELGFTAKVKIHTEWCQAEFCSSLFWPVKDGYVLGPKIFRRLPKLGFSINKLSQRQVKGLFDGAAREMAHLPVLGLVVEKNLSFMTRIISGKLPYSYQYKSLCIDKHVRTADTDEFFRERYGLTADEADAQVAECLSLCKTITTCVNLPLLDQCKSIDN